MKIEKEYTAHTTVLKNECLEYLTSGNLSEDISYFADLTFGGGGHSLAILEHDPKFKVIAVDQDIEAIDNAQKNIITKYPQRLTVHHSNYLNFKSIIKKNHDEIINEFGGFQGIILDIGVSNHQFEASDRGFSFKRSGPLDMRMNQTDKSLKSAADYINNSDQEELEFIFKTFGEERFSKVISERIIEKRAEKKITTTKELEDIIFHAYPKKMRYGSINPSTKCFQALRIIVNSELEVLENILPELVELLRPTGKLLVISFHSLEDRIVKHSFRQFARTDKSCKIITKRPIIANEDEINRNKKSRSAKLRVIEKLGEPRSMR